MQTSNEVLLDFGTRHQIYLQRFASGLVNKFTKILQDGDSVIADKLATRLARLSSADRSIVAAGSPAKTNAHKAFLAFLKATQESAKKIFSDALAVELREFSSYEADFAKRSLEKALPPVGIAVNTAKQTDINNLVWATPLALLNNKRSDDVVRLKPFLERWPERKAQAINNSVKSGLLNAESDRQVVSRVKQEALRASIVTAAVYIRTAVNHTANKARSAAYMANSDLVKEEIYRAVLDSATSHICASLDGTIYKVGEGQFPPLHINCRSTRIPVLYSYRSLGVDGLTKGQKQALDGKIPDTLSYGQWLSKQPLETAEEVLGKTKAKLFRQGNLSVDKFVDRKGNTLNLSQLMKREPEAFRLAEI